MMITMTMHHENNKIMDNKKMCEKVEVKEMP